MAKPKRKITPKKSRRQSQIDKAVGRATASGRKKVARKKR